MSAGCSDWGLAGEGWLYGSAVAGGEDDDAAADSDAGVGVDVGDDDNSEWRPSS